MSHHHLNLGQLRPLTTITLSILTILLWHGVETLSDRWIPGPPSADAAGLAPADLTAPETIGVAVESLQATIAVQQAQIEQLSAAVAGLQNEQMDLMAVQEAGQVSLVGTEAALQADIAAIEYLLDPFSRSEEGDDVFLTGVNLHVLNGAGETATTNGLGNIIIGYNETRPAGNDRAGSHMLVVGSRNNFSSYGGIVAGLQNSAAGEYASVSGGRANSAEGNYAAISGGWSGVAEGDYSAIGGGFENVTDGAYTSVSGGQRNLASGIYAAGGGGRANVAAGQHAAVSGGEGNRSDGRFASITGGQNNVAGDDYDAVETLLQHISREGDELFITGANLHVVNGAGGTATINGLGNIIIGYNEAGGQFSDCVATTLVFRCEPEDDRSGSHMLVVGSQNNYSSYGGIVAGFDNSASNRYVSITGGRSNVANGAFASVGGGNFNFAEGEHSHVAGGNFNVAGGDNAFIGGGAFNLAGGNYASITGGQSNEAASDYDSVETSVSVLQTDVTALGEDLAVVQTDVAAVTAAVGTVQEDVETLRTDVGALRADLTSVETDVASVEAGVAAVETDVTSVEADVTAAETELETAATAIEALESLLQHVSREGNNLYITGANLYVVNGTGSTDGATNGLGNIIIGYNERRGGGQDERSGSHMLVVGYEHNYVGYAGIIVGHRHYTEGPFSSITGGTRNAAANGGSVSGGSFNTAAALLTSVIGGSGHGATEEYQILPEPTTIVRRYYSCTGVCAR